MESNGFLSYLILAFSSISVTSKLLMINEAFTKEMPEADSTDPFQGLEIASTCHS